MDRNAPPPTVTSHLLRIGGRVQAVGFRPFCHRMATQFSLSGEVENRGAEVQLLLQGDDSAIAAMLEALLNEPPPLAQPQLLEQRIVQAPPCDGFTIKPSSAVSHEKPSIPADSFVCDDCLQEMENPQDRRYRYPFINCTQCGPRYTLIESLPYDRPNTTMAAFALCDECREEYENPADRRFHAEPVACPACGPQLEFVHGDEKVLGNEEALRATLTALGRGETVAVKGIGGYHLMCDASSTEAVDRLRRRKLRPHKPLAVMFAQSGKDGLAPLRSELNPTEAEAQLLRSPQRPIVLCRNRATGRLADNLAPGLTEIGAMLPYSPLHHLLLQGFGRPLVATSGNISGEPVLTDSAEAEQRLAAIADAFLHHDRPICRPADDPVYRTTVDAPVPLRLGRGNAPLERRLPFRLERPLLAVGGEMKNSIALAWEDRAVLSPHIGELHTLRGMEVFEQVGADLQRLYGVTAEQLVHDAHPDYHSSRWASVDGRSATAVFHHHSHASGLYAEHWPGSTDEPWLVVTWDGVGYGADGTLWGGETLLGSPGRWRRYATLRPFRLPGGDRAGREPWRSALSLCLEAGLEWRPSGVESELYIHAWQRNLNSPTTSAAGRLFDAAAALLDLCSEASFEGQAPMLLEAQASEENETPETYPELPLMRLDSGLLQCDWTPLLSLLLDNNTATTRRAALFHHSLAQNLLQQALQARQEHGITTVGLSGGVFQNRYLSRLTTALLQQEGFVVKTARAIPANDGGLAWGQIIEAALSSSRAHGE